MARTKQFTLVCLTAGMIAASAAGWGQTPVQLKFSRVVDLTLPVESNMAGIPGFKIYADNLSQAAIIAAMTQVQKNMLQGEGMTMGKEVEINGRSMISILHIM